jgi:shikimate 5-dehydrogenase
LVLTDCVMPGMDGIAFTAERRKLDGGQTIVILLTGYSWEDKLEEATKAGVDSVSSKPLFKDSQKISVFTFQEFPSVSKEYKIIINATSVGMTPNEDESPLDRDSLNPGQVVCDIVYAPPKTKLLKLATEKGCKTVTGEGMLVHQGLESFKKWFPEQVKGHTDEELLNIMRKGMEGI